MIKFNSILLAFLILAFSSVYSQNLNLEDDYINTITTSVPFLIISPDARSGGMGDIGVASSPDAMSMHWNPSKLAFVSNDFGATVSYTPWLKSLVPDINLNYLTGYQRTSNGVIGFAFRYFTLGEINFTDRSGESLGSFNPNELSISGAYALKLSNNLSTSVSLRYIYSNLTGGQSVGADISKAGQTVAGDISAYYIKKIDLGGRDFAWSIGTNISNIGGKISYSESANNDDFIPTNLRIGSALSTQIDRYNTISFEFDINKLLVPTPDPLDPFAGNDISSISGIFQSFSDAPAGDKEIKELIYAIGAEYWYDNQFALRLGYFYEHPDKGDRQFFTLGTGVKYNVFGLDFSYLIPIQDIDETAVNPLANTLRFSLTFDFGSESKNDNK
jgi:hypothetical protein